ncbi:Hsp70 family protein [Anaplasmataceae bacterium AB001_6]|nr:Hsp70 family protein [Anaplasmataceae bacterium AB001_6]
MNNFITIEEPKKNLDGIAIGIDFGTTNSLIAYAKNGIIEIVPIDDEDNYYFPSAFAYEDDQSFFGYAALDKKNHIASIKRLLGKTVTESIETTHSSIHNIDFEDSSRRGSLNFKLGEKKFNTVDITAEILKILKYKAEKYLNTTVDKAVITVPAYFDEVARSAIYDAANIANIKVLRLLNEPTAALMHYKSNFSDKSDINNKICAVYDLGGGTFDVSILNVQGDIVKVLGVGGDNNLGGDDFDYLLYDMVCTYLRDIHSFKEIPDILKQQIIRDMPSLKCKLNDNDEISYSVKFNGAEYCCHVIYDNFENASHPLLNSTYQILLSTLQSLDLGIDEIDYIVFVGGSTKMRILKNFFQEKLKQLCFYDDPDKAVVKGAAKYAEKLSFGYGEVILDVIPLSIGLETMGGIIEKLIPCNSPLPISVTQSFTNYSDDQRYMSVRIWQGEREILDQEMDTKGIRFLGEFSFKLSNFKAGKARVDITFKVDQNGLLIVSAEDKLTGNKKSIELSYKDGIDDDAIDRLIGDSCEYGMMDSQFKKKIDKKRKLEELLSLCKDSLSKNIDTESSEFLRNSLNDAYRLLKIDVHDLKVEDLDVVYDKLENRVTTYLSSKIDDILDSNIDKV